jgi:hypothetical protein
MGVFLQPNSGGDDDAIKINWWHWRPTVAILERAGILPPGERTERCLENGCGGYLTSDEALRAAVHVDALVERLGPEERILLDGEKSTKERATLRKSVGEWDDEDLRQVYGADADWLGRFARFCRSSGGFTVL